MRTEFRSVRNDTPRAIGPRLNKVSGLEPIWTTPEADDRAGGKPVTVR